uniref:ANK_REP_REGION domain-containing protein n=1 Tax=Panagrellus redivivus TaxID=6233 RepID=A0A7E4UVF4_PANRE
MSKTQVATEVAGDDDDEAPPRQIDRADRNQQISGAPIPSILETEEDAEVDQPPLPSPPPPQVVESQPIGQLIIGDKIIQDCVAKKVADVIATADEDEVEEKSFPEEVDEAVANRFRAKVRQAFEMKGWDKSHMPKHCEYKLFKAANPYMRFYLMEFLKNHADSILRAHGYTIGPPRCVVTKEGTEWLHSPAVDNELDGFLKCRAWMLENWSFFKKYPDNETRLTNFEGAQDVPLIFMAAMKESVNTTDKLDYLLKLMLDKGANYLDSTPKSEWQIADKYPMKVIAILFEEGAQLPVCACSMPTETTKDPSIDTPEGDSPKVENLQSPPGPSEPKKNTADKPVKKIKHKRGSKDLIKLKGSKEKDKRLKV